MVKQCMTLWLLILSFIDSSYMGSTFQFSISITLVTFSELFLIRIPGFIFNIYIYFDANTSLLHCAAGIWVIFVYACRRAAALIRESEREARREGHCTAIKTIICGTHSNAHFHMKNSQTLQFMCIGNIPLTTLVHLALRHGFPYFYFTWRIEQRLRRWPSGLANS